MRTRHPTSSSGLTDSELIRELDEATSYSPIIKDLCDRLTKANERPTVRSANCDCPVCLSVLEADYDEANDILQLKVAK